MPPLSDGAYVRQIFGDQCKSRKNWVVINDEAHHAWFVEGSSAKGTTKKEQQESTKWVQGLNRIHKVSRILHCFDFSATPFAPTNAKNLQTELFGWIVSDFGLSDAIESGLVKTPRAITGSESDSQDGSNKFRHIYPQIKDDLNRKAKPDDPLPQILVNAYHLLAEDYHQTYESWMQTYDSNDTKIPPVQITVANRTETAERVAHTFKSGAIPVAPLTDSDRILHIDSKVLKKAEDAAEATATSPSSPPQNATERQESLRTQVDTVGKANQPGEQLTNIVSVMMLSEGWDARNVTQIMGLRAFTSQLLCEQVIGRGLRRRSYDLQPDSELLEPEFVTVFGVPYSLLLSDTSEGLTKPTPTKEICVLRERGEMKISWPNVTRIDEELRTTLTLDHGAMDSFVIDFDPVTAVNLGLTIDGKVDKNQIARIDLQEAVARYRIQTSIFRIVKDLYLQKRPSWRGYPAVHFAQLVALTNRFVRSSKLKFNPELLDPEVEDDPIAVKLAIALSVQNIVDHIWDYIKEHNTNNYLIQLDQFKPIGSTADMTTWYTAKPVYDTKRSHINRCVNDSGWEQTVAETLDSNKHVVAWVKITQRLGFSVSYQWKGASRKYVPDFIVKLTNGKHLVLEVKGVETDRDRAKFKALQRWCTAVSAQDSYGEWHAEILYSVEQTPMALSKYID